ncbi:MAG: DUF3443 family protein [Burkholderiales bacterium]|nr:DUF3443 family protein [Burkholderiales bacterium]
MALAGISRFSPRRARAGLRVAAFAACLLLVSCGGGGRGASSASASGPADATSVPAAPASNPVIVSIGANPGALTAGESTTLTWSGSNASGCQASGDWSGALATSGTRLVTPAAAGSYTYTLTCDGVARSLSLSVAAAPTAMPSVSLALEPANAVTGQSSTLSWSATNASACVASGAWAGNKGASGSTAVSQAVAGTYTYALSCTGAGGSASGSVNLGVSALAGNMAPVFIDSGPAGANNVINVPFVSVTLCRPGTSTCQSIDHVLVDTGSYGLRIIAPGVLDTALALPPVVAPGGGPVGECAQFVSGYLWGSVHRADVKIAGELAPALPVHLAADSAAAFANIPLDCSSSGADLGSVARLGAKGILGVGLFNHDCGAGCAAHALPGSYYECAAAGCAGIAMPLSEQVANPVAAFAANNNGVALAMPAVAAGGATTLTGALIFGVDTQSNNNVGAATVYAANSSGNFTTVYKGRALASSFLDSGSNGLFFSDPSIPRCSVFSGYNGFYCPAGTLALSAVNTAADGTASGTVSFSVENPQALDLAVKAASVGGSIGSARRPTAFDWGMPFFFGRTVYVVMDGAGTLHGTGPYWAY